MSRLEALEKPKAEERQRDGWQERDRTLAPSGAEVIHGRAPTGAQAQPTSHYKVSSVIGPTLTTMALFFVVFSPSMLVGPA